MGTICFQRSLRILPVAVLTICWTGASSKPARCEEDHPAAPNAQTVDFLHDVQPLLATKCFACHGPREQEGGLRLDIKARLLQGGDSGPVIRAGNSADSEIIRRITSDDESERMPPEGEPLDERQITLLRNWIDEGAQGMPAGDARHIAIDHWAFQPIARPVPPQVVDNTWVRNPLDHFILARLEANHIRPSAPASRETLIRRLSLDLLGLPPRWERMAQFVADQRPDAYERLVDEILESPHYGERWGRHWLDLARYAETAPATNRTNRARSGPTVIG